MPYGIGPTDVQREFFRRMDGEALIQSDFTEFLTSAEGITAVAAGAGAGVFGPPLGVTDGHPGVWVLRTGTLVLGRVFLISDVGAYSVANGPTKFQSWVQVPIVSTVAERFVVRSGFASVVLPNTLLQSIGFEYQDDENVNWQALCHDGAETSVDTGIVVTAGQWYKLEFEVNDGATSVEFFIDDVSVATIATNIPGVGFNQFTNIHIIKLVGLLPRDLYIDAYAIFQETGGRV